jgi:sulfur carrier protein ThiS
MPTDSGRSDGTSKDRGALGTLPLVASPPPRVTIHLELRGAGRNERRDVEVPVGSPLRDALRSAGIAPEGVAAFREERPVPLDEPVEGEGSYLILSAFSGG